MAYQINQSTAWNPFNYCRPELWQDKKLRVCIVLLNTSLVGVEKRFRELWENASYRVAVDGGCNELVRLDKEKQLCLKSHMPNFVSGDFDSITPTSEHYLKNLNCRLVRTLDQDYTDFTKCLKILEDEFSDGIKKIDIVIPVVRHQGRYDHIFANVNTLFEATQLCLPKITVLSFDSLSWLLMPGRHEIHLEGIEATSHCALVPIGGQCESCFTEGLKWNLNKESMKFGQLVSTSNTYAENSKLAIVETSDPLLWIMEI